MTQSTVADKFQTTIPLEVRRALKLSPRQKISYQMQTDGSVLMRPMLGLDDLFGSVKLKRAVGSIREEKQAAREGMAKDAAREGLK